MAYITAELNTDNFRAAFGDSEFVRSFSEDAVEAILDVISEHQSAQEDSEDNEVLDWTGFFIQAGELSAENLVDYYGSTVEDEGLECEVIDMVRELDSLTAELDERLDNEEELSSSELLAELKSQFKELSGWTEGIADIIAESKSITKLDNGNFLTFN